MPPVFRPEIRPSQQVDGDPNLKPGMCGWTQSIKTRWDNQNTEYDAFQVTLAQAYHHGLNFDTNYVWASAFDENYQLVLLEPRDLPHA